MGICLHYSCKAVMWNQLRAIVTVNGSRRGCRAAVVGEAPAVYIGLSKNKWFVVPSTTSRVDRTPNTAVANHRVMSSGMWFVLFFAFLWVVLISGKGCTCNGKRAPGRASPAPSWLPDPTGKSTFIQTFSKGPGIASTGGHLANILVTMTRGRVKFNWVTWAKHVRNSPPLTPLPHRNSREKGVGY